MPRWHEAAKFSAQSTPEGPFAGRCVPWRHTEAWGAGSAAARHGTIRSWKRPERLGERRRQPAAES